MSANSAKLTILVVDDEPELCRAVQRILERINYRVLLASNGLEALDILNSESVLPDLVLSDICMPELNGLELSKKIKIEYPTIAIILMTGFAELNYAHEAIEVGVHGFIQKPFRLQQLKQVIIEALQAVSEEAVNLDKPLRNQLSANLQSIHSDFFHEEKLISLGRLSAGIAHELNNPIGFVLSNLTTLSEYMTDLQQLIVAYENVVCQARGSNDKEIIHACKKLVETKRKINYEFIFDDLKPLVSQTQSGATRIKQIAADLKVFSHPGTIEKDWYDINEGLELAVKIIHNDIKNSAKLSKYMNELPKVFCRGQQINQVFLNLLMNATQAITGYGEIAITTYHDDDLVYITIKDNGSGMSDKTKGKVLDPFFTTKPVGQGTGLGLSVVYGIIKDHDGELLIESELNVGTEFTVVLPVNANPAKEE